MIYHIKQMILELMFIEQRIFVSVSEALILKSWTWDFLYCHA